MFRKNVASQFLEFTLISTTDGSDVTGATVTVRRCIDGTFAAGGGTVTEDANGLYKYAMSQADTNGNNIGFQFRASGAVSVCLNIVTTAGDPTDAVRFGLTALPNANAAASGGLIINGSNAGTVTLAALTVTAATTLTGNVSMAAGLTITQSTTNADGVSITGNGSGHGIHSTGGAAVTTTAGGHGMRLDGGASSTGAGGTAGNGLKATGGAGSASQNGAAAAVVFTGGGTNTVASAAHGLSVTGTSTGSGLNAGSGAGATGDGITATSAATAGYGLSLTGNGSGNGLNATGGATGSGAAFNSGASGGVGLGLNGNAANSTGLLISGGPASGANPAGAGIQVTGGAASNTGGGVAGIGIIATGGAGGSSNNGPAVGAQFSGGTLVSVAAAAHGLQVVGTSTGSGLAATSGSGATGNGITATAVSSNGSGLACVSTGTGSGILTDKLTTSGAVVFGSTFTVTTNFLVSGTTTHTGAVSFGSTFGVTGLTTLTGLTTGALSCTTITASGAVAFQSTFAVTTSTALAALSCTTLTASGAVAFQSTFIVTGAVTFSSTFATTGTTTFNAFTVTNATTLSGAVSLGSTLGVTGTVTFNAFTVTNALTVSGATTLTGAVTATNAGNDLRGITLKAGSFVTATFGTCDFTSDMKISIQTAADAAITANVTVTEIGADVDELIVSVAAIPTNPYTGTPPTAAAIATAVLTSTAGGDLGTSGSLGYIVATQLGGAFTTSSSSVFTVAALANAPGGSGSDPWLTALPGSYIAGQAGYILGTYLDAAISSRSTYAGADTSGTTTLLSRLTAGRAGYLDNLSGGAVALESEAVLIYNAVVAIPTTDNTSAITAIKAKTDNLPATPAATGDAMTLTGAYDFAKGTVAMTESYAPNKSQPTPIQALYAIHQELMGFAINGTSYVVTQLDGATPAFTVTLDSATAPTAAARN